MAINNFIPVGDEQEGDDRILVVVRIVRGVTSLLTPVGNEHALKFVLINAEDQDEDEVALREEYAARYNLAKVVEMTGNEMQDEIES